MRATRLFLLGLAALALTVHLGCDKHGRAQRAARAKKGGQVAMVKVAVGDAQVGPAVKGGEPQAAPPAAPAPKAQPKPEPLPPPKVEPKREAPPVPPKQAPTAGKVRKAWEVKVWVQGKNRLQPEVQREAEEQALRRACDEVQRYLSQQSPPLTWTPSVAYVRKHLVAGPVKRLEGEDQPIKVEGGEFQAQRWALPVAITEKQYQDMARLDREARGGERMLLAGQVLGGALLLLAVVLGFLRLDEWAGGAYTRRLRGSLSFLLGKPRRATST
jgi:hypothetical protein